MYFAILMRCASPPESVPVPRLNDRYPRPICISACRRLASSRLMSTASGSSMAATNSTRSEIGMSPTSAMFLPFMRHERIFSFRRVPLQSGQVPIVSIGFIAAAWSRPSSEFMMLRYIRGTRPSYLAVFGQFDGGFFNFICGEYRKRSSSSGV